MRALFAAIVLLAPSAAAASHVHVTYDGEGYHAIVGSEARPDVRIEGREVETDHVSGTTWRATLPAASLTYTVDGRSFELRAPPSRASATRIAFVADMGTGPDAKAIVAAMVAADPHLVLIGGDLAYAHANESVWSDWSTIMEPLAARVPILPAYGNHEDVCDTGNNTYRPCFAERDRYLSLFELPGEDLFYALDWGPVRLTTLDTEAWEKEDGTHASGRAEQVAFLEGSLDADDERWDIAMFHRPLRSTSTREGAASDAARADLQPILDAKADLVLAGHLHAYERSRVLEGAPLYVTSGGGGRNLYDQWGPEAPWLATRAVEHHFVLLDVTPTTIEGRAVRPDGTTFDAFTLEKPAPPTPATPPVMTSRPTVDPPPTATTAGSPATSPTDPSATSPQEASIPFPTPVLAAAALALALRRRPTPSARP